MRPGRGYELSNQPSGSRTAIDPVRGQGTGGGGEGLEEALLLVELDDALLLIELEDTVDEDMPPLGAFRARTAARDSFD